MKTAEGYCAGVRRGTVKAPATRGTGGVPTMATPGLGGGDRNGGSLPGAIRATATDASRRWVPRNPQPWSTSRYAPDRFVPALLAACSAAQFGAQPSQRLWMPMVGDSSNLVRSASRLWPLGQPSASPRLLQRNCCATPWRCWTSNGNLTRRGDMSDLIGQRPDPGRNARVQHSGLVHENATALSASIHRTPLSTFRASIQVIMATCASRSAVTLRGSAFRLLSASAWRGLAASKAAAGRWHSSRCRLPNELPIPCWVRPAGG